MPHGAIANHLFLPQSLTGDILRRQHQPPKDTVGSRRVALAGLAVAALSLAAWVGIRNRGYSYDRARLVAAVGAVRPSEGRFTGGFQYALFTGRSVRVKSKRELAYARGAIEKALRRGASPRVLADLGVLSLMGGQPVLAVNLLEKARSQNSADASIWSDLSAAYMAKSRFTGQFADLLLALEAADSAVRLDPTLPEARFNFALILDRLFFRYRARAEWTYFLQMADSPDWRREAEQRLATLFEKTVGELWHEHRLSFESLPASGADATARALVAQFPQQARELAEEELLGRWADTHALNNLEATRIIQLIRSLGQAFTADRMIDDAVRFIVAAESGESSALDLLVDAHLKYQKGLAAYDRGSLEEAARLFLSAGDALQLAQSPFQLWTEFRLALCDYQVFRYAAAAGRLTKALGHPRISRYPAFRARALWLLGLIHGIRGEPAESLAAYRQSLEIFNQLGELENRAVVSNLLAEVHRNLGDLSGAWQFHAIALEGTKAVVKAARRRLILSELGVSLLADGRAKIAIYAFEERLRDEKDPRPEAVVGSLRRMAEAYHARGEFERALNLLGVAQHELAAVADKHVREAVQADLVALEGRVNGDLAPNRAVGLLTTALALYQETDYIQQLVRLRLERARALRHEGKYRQAESDLRSAIALIGGYRPDGGPLAGSIGDVRQVFGEMVRLQVLQGQFQFALEHAERGRNRILELLAPANLHSLIPAFTVNELQEALPPSVALVEWWIEEQEVFLWTIRRDRCDFIRFPIDVARLDRTIREFRQAALADDLVGLETLGTRLYTAILAPAESSFHDAERLVLVVDKSLYSVPFAALRRSPKAPFLIERHILSVTPSAGLYLRCLRRSRELGDEDLGVAAFGNPLFNRSLFSDLPDLPHSEREATEVLGIYRKGRLIVGADLTRARLLKEISAWPILHIAGHAVATPPNPFSSALLLAPSTNDSGVLYFRDFARRPLRGTRLAVLSACSTLGGDSGAGVELASPLVIQGVPAVVGTLWPVISSRTGPLIRVLHLRFAESRDAAKSLRDAQLSLLRVAAERRRPSLWASFELVGAQ